MGLNLEILDSDTIEPLEKKLFAEHDGINKKKAQKLSLTSCPLQSSFFLYKVYNKNSQGA